MYDTRRKVLLTACRSSVKKNTIIDEQEILTYFSFHIQGCGKLVFMERDSLRRLYEFDVIESVSRIFHVPVL